MIEPVAIRYDFDGNGYLYMDAGSGSDWASRVKDCEFLYTHPMRDDEDDDIFRKEQVEKFYAEARPLREKYKPRELTDEEIAKDTECKYCKQGCFRCDARKTLSDEEILEVYKDVFGWFAMDDDKQVKEFARAILKKASEK
jgi:hypothetical protein